MDARAWLSTYMYGEARTATGQSVEFTCAPDDVAHVHEFVQTKVRTIDGRTTKQVSIEHGGYGRYTRYDVVQHKYAGGGPDENGGGGYIEVLEIKNPPDGRCGSIVYEYSTYDGGVFTEWETLEQAIAAFEKCWSGRHSAEVFRKLPGYKRRVFCATLTPWFYAIGEELLVGDYTFPDGLQDDAVFRFGQRFVTFDEDGYPAIKTCMGTRFINRKRDHYPYEEVSYRVVYWSDGSSWDERMQRGEPPRALEEGELWITEAIREFGQLLAGKKTQFEINFTGGNKFVGKLVRANTSAKCAEGDYLVVVQTKGQKTPQKGWVRDFKPSKKASDIVQYVVKDGATKGFVVERVDVLESKTKPGGKKWSGVFFQPSS